MNVRILRNSTVTHLPILSAKRWGVGGGGGAAGFDGQMSVVSF